MRCAAIGWALTSIMIAHAAPSTNLPHLQLVTVLLDFEEPHSAASLEAMPQELNRILAPAGFKIDVQVRNELTQASESRELVLFKMKGSCRMDGLPIGALSDERGALAMTYSVDGELLNFGEVECDRVRGAVQRALGRGNATRQESAYGRAIARVMAHELYHMLTHSAVHTKQGVTKESLSGWELSQGTLKLNSSAREAFRNSYH